MNVLEELRAKWPDYAALVEREQKHVHEKHHTAFLRMCREQRRVSAKNVPNFVSIYLIAGEDAAAVNHAIRVTERAVGEKIPTPKPGEWPDESR